MMYKVEKDYYRDYADRIDSKSVIVVYIYKDIGDLNDLDIIEDEIGIIYHKDNEVKFMKLHTEAVSNDVIYKLNDYKLKIPESLYIDKTHLRTLRLPKDTEGVNFVPVDGTTINYLNGTKIVLNTTNFD